MSPNRCASCDWLRTSSSPRDAVANAAFKTDTLAKLDASDFCAPRFEVCGVVMVMARGRTVSGTGRGIDEAVGCAEADSDELGREDERSLVDGDESEDADR